MRAPRVHHAARRRGGGVAARGARAAARADAADRCAHARSRERSGGSGPDAAFQQGLRELGWTDGRNVRIESVGPRAMPTTSADTRRNWSRSRRTSSLRLAARLCAALQQATRSLPIVFVLVPDPVGSGFVASLARPGGNVTGFTSSEYRRSAANGWNSSKRSHRA